MRPSSRAPNQRFTMGRLIRDVQRHDGGGEQKKPPAFPSPWGLQRHTLIFMTTPVVRRVYYPLLLGGTGGIERESMEDTILWGQLIPVVLIVSGSPTK